MNEAIHTNGISLDPAPTSSVLPPATLLPTKRSPGIGSHPQSPETGQPEFKKLRFSEDTSSGQAQHDDINEATPGGDGSGVAARRKSQSRSQPSLLSTAVAMLSGGEPSLQTNPDLVNNRVAGGRIVPTTLSPSQSMTNDNGHGLPNSKPRLGQQKTSGKQMLGLVGLVDYLQEDEQPTFVIDLEDPIHQNSHGLNLIFTNNALRSRPGVVDLLEGNSHDSTLMLDLGTPLSDFKAWVLTQDAAPDIVAAFPFAQLSWRYRIIRKRLKVFAGQPQTPSLTPNELRYRPSLQSYKGLSSTSTLPLRGSASVTSAPGYFDVRPRNSGSVYSDAVNSDHSMASPTSISDTTTPAAGGDMRYAELLSGSLSPVQEQTVIPSQLNAEDMEGMGLTIESRNGFFDWTRLPISPSLPPHIQFARNIDWAATSLGPIELWTADLRGMCNLIMASPHPAAMYWGREHVAIYNEAYILIAGQKHPGLMGSRYCDAWAEIWDALQEVFDNAFANAQAIMKDDDCLFLTRNGYLEETYFSWSIIPLVGDDGSVVGLYNPAFEKTRRKVAERRMLTLREIGEKTASARHVSQFWDLLLEGMEYNEFDAPMVMIYSLMDDTSGENDVVSSASSGAASTKICCLEGSIGIPSEHTMAPKIIDMKTSSAGFAPIFRQALTNDRPIVLRVDDGTLDAESLEGIEWRGFGDPSRVVVISPIHPTTGESTLGFLVMGTNPRRPYDEDYDLFVQLLGRQLATSVASVVLFEEEIRKGERAAQLAAQDRIELSNQLVARTQEAVEAENKFTRLAELAPVGMYMGDSSGKIVFVNDVWYDISSYPRGRSVGNEWISCVLEEDQPKAWASWTKMMKHKCPISLEFRFKTPWRDKMGNSGHTWVIASASPEKDDDGQIKRVFGSITDISTQKFAENLQTRRMEEAVELKRQQERYIDTTSHEMRNPLSAILQSADSISGSLSELRDSEGLTAPQRELLDLTVDSAQTILLCAQHQKRIVDDVLTLSKLDSAMMAVTPVDAQPVNVVKRTLKMFEGEFQTADIALELRIDDSYTKMELDWVRIDPHRLSQVLINLTTNAIKFTTTQDKRTIRMHIAASKEKPARTDQHQVTYVQNAIPRDKDVTAAPEWGLGDTIYLHFAVEDTGRGLDDLEKKQLFQRFQQANPRTHVTYGGSGLGLFISRQLVELQGGEIGVASEAGKGSTFAFYIKARKSSQPANGAEEDLLRSMNSRKSSKTTKLSKIKSQAVQALPSAPASPKTGAEGNKLGDLHVLIVEDNLINQKVLASQLRKAGFTIYVANHGGEAIDQIMQSKFCKGRVHDGITIDVVLMDLEMPVMDGRTCARKLRIMQTEGELVRHIPVIAVTANAREEQIKMTLESGIDDVVSKPFRIPELIPKMKDVIARFPIPSA